MPASDIADAADGTGFTDPQVGLPEGSVDEANRRPRALIEPFVFQGRVLRGTLEDQSNLNNEVNWWNSVRDELKERDPEWRPQTESIYETATGAIDAYRALRQEGQARLLFLDRGYPLGFETRDDFEAFGRIARDGFRQAGYDDAEPYIRGSAITGYSYDTNAAFDSVRRSDYDLAVVSESLFLRARDLGVGLRGSDTRTDVLGPRELDALGIRSMTDALEAHSGRDNGWVVYRNLDALNARRPYFSMP